MEVVAFVGPAGTGKSYKAQKIAREVNADAIIDDGLLIQGGKVWAGNSAKNEQNRIQAVKRAIFSSPEHTLAVKQAIEKAQPKCILILGTSIEMVKRISGKLGLPEPSKYVKIEDVSTKEEINKARDSRLREGKHVVPVPTVELKRHYSGYLFDPFRGFFSKNKSKHEEHIAKSIVRPSFSMYGKMLIADAVIVDIVRLSIEDVKEISRVLHVNVKLVQNQGKSVMISLEVILLYGSVIKDTVKLIQSLIKRQVEFMTAMNVLSVNVSIRSLALK